MLKKMRLLVILLLLQLNFHTVLAKTEKIYFISQDSVKILGEISSLEGSQKNTIVINVFPCLITKLTSETDFHGGSGDFFPLLKNKILSKGISYFEFRGRRDSMVVNNIKIPSSTMLTKEEDLSAAITFIKSRNDLKNKKTVWRGLYN